MMKKQVDAGCIGQLKIMKLCSRDNPLPPLEYLRTSGGIFQDMLIHDFDMQDWLLDGQMPESVLAVAHCYNEALREMGDVDTVATVAKYASGLIAMTDVCRDASYGYYQRVEAFGDKGMLTAKNELTSTVELAASEGHLMPSALWSFPDRYKDAYRAELSSSWILFVPMWTVMCGNVSSKICCGTHLSFTLPLRLIFRANFSARCPVRRPGQGVV